MRHILLFAILLFSILLKSQDYRWQQAVEYDMNIDMNVENFKFTGEQTIKYTNNSPDTLQKIFYHLYFNAFQPGSMMDVRSRTISDPDGRVGDRISKLKDNEIGYHRIDELKQDGEMVRYHVEGTILEVDLTNPILPGETTKLEMKFNSQVPVQIRRSGRDNREGISLSMAQWYPKLCEYDYQGWHANPYVGREFHGVWGDFNVSIKIDRKYTVAASGLVRNPQKMGHGYSDKNTKKKKLFGKKKLTWEFHAERVHDFVWAADPDYTHLMQTTDAGTALHYFFQANERTTENWENLHAAMNEAEKFMNERYGTYPYPTYAFIQGGDGGMEYPMATLITGERSFPSLVGVSIHEWMHSWYQMVLATNESLYSWMDEGFTSFATAEVMNHLRKKGYISGEVREDPHVNTVKGFARWASTGKDEALTTHADHFTSNRAYGIAAYTKGNVFLKQLSYIMGDEAFYKALKRYFNEWQFKHPNPNDFIRVMEKTSGLELDWYKEYFVQTTHTIDYGIKDVLPSEGGTIVVLEKIGYMPMPMDITVYLKNGTKKFYYIPLRIMRGEKGRDIFEGKLEKDWPWTHPEYELYIDVSPDEIEKILIDESTRFSDVDYNNNVWPVIPDAD
ncbi:MAG: M1 family metallopeptidase [Saprospiraceae bacterium]|nr:M1 family metallopeptidase [Saprospiraceae bacterium]